MQLWRPVHTFIIYTVFKPDNIENNFFFNLSFDSNPEELGSGKVLISEPFLPDPNFSRSVVLISEYSKEEGAFGFVINKPTEVPVKDLLDAFPSGDFQFHNGGPVQQNNLFFLHTLGEGIPNSREIMPGIYWSGDLDEALAHIRSGALDENGIKFFTGYSGWSPGQLEDELKERSWIISKLSAEDVMQMPSEALWKKSLKNLGTKYSIMADFPEDPMMN